MNPISLCMILKNESQCIRRAINSVKEFVSEILICDNFSTDNTVEIISEYKPQILIYKELNGDYAQLRNSLWEYVSFDWTLWLDADEVFDKSVCEWFPFLLEYAQKNEIDYYTFIRRTYVDGQIQNPFNIDFQRRLCKKSCHWESPLHEYIVGNKGCDLSLTFDHIKTLEMQNEDTEHYNRNWKTENDKWVYLG